MADTLVNKTVRFSQEQIDGLIEEGQRDRREFSELVRIAVDDLLALRRRVSKEAGITNGAEAAQ